MKNVPVVSKDGPFLLISPPSASVFECDKLDASLHCMQINYMYIISFNRQSNNNNKHIIDLCFPEGKTEPRDLKLFTLGE